MIIIRRSVASSGRLHFSRCSKWCMPLMSQGVSEWLFNGTSAQYRLFSAINGRMPEMIYIKSNEYNIDVAGIMVFNPQSYTQKIHRVITKGFT